MAEEQYYEQRDWCQSEPAEMEKRFVVTWEIDIAAVLVEAAAAQMTGSVVERMELEKRAVRVWQMDWCLPVD